MRTMKKHIPLLLLLILMFSGCGKSGQAMDGEEIRDQTGRDDDDHRREVAHSG